MYFMKNLMGYILLFAWVAGVAGQSSAEPMQGEVSYVSSQNVYVKFPGTSFIHPGDTLYRDDPGGRIPVLSVNSTSFISCICAPLGGYAPAVGDQVLFVLKQENVRDSRNRKNARETQIEPWPQESRQSKGPTVGAESSRESRKYKAALRGKVGVNAYSAFSENKERNYLRMRYRLAVDAMHIGGSGVSAQTYVTFNHKSGEWDQVQSNLFNGLKVYKLNVRYQATPSTEFLVGRAINSHISNIGAIDGFQARQNIGKFTLGGIAGTRPDYEDYGFNGNLLQFGGYVSHTTRVNDRPFSNSVAVMEQKNGGRTDRRFLYFQHSSAPVSNLYLFSSFDVNLYEVRDSVAKNTFGLTSLYVLLRYNISKDLSVTTSYDLRNNVIYYETYRNYLDQLIEEETRQGLSASLRYRIFDFMSLGLRGSYRYRKDDPSPAGNYSAYLYFSQLPAEGMRVHVSSNIIRTSYLTGAMYGIRLSQELVAGKLSGELQYRIFDGRYAVSDAKTLHHITELQLQWNVYRKLSMMVSYEAMLEDGILNNRLYLLASQRF